jgi:iron-only hydrogenase group A
MIFDIEVNNKIIKARRGETILSALNRSGIKVPTLCHLEELLPTGACRLCVVEVEGRESLVPACSEVVMEWMKIQTHSPRVIKARKTIVELLLSNHPDDCLYCERNGNCDLQNLSVDLNILDRRISGTKNKFKTDRSSSSMIHDPKKCVLCGRCVRVCDEIAGVSTLDFVRRGNECAIETAYGKSLNLSSCISCGQCLMVCPTGALYERDHLPELIDSLHNPQKHVVVQYSPIVAVSLAEEFGVKAGKEISGNINAALRKIGFNRVFDGTFGHDLKIYEEAAELHQRLKNNGVLPMFSSCCPAWVKYLEQNEVSLIPNLSTCKSAQQMQGALLKNYYPEKNNIEPDSIYSVSIVPCIARKFEAQREQMTHKGITDVDAVLTTREFTRLIRIFGIDVLNSEPELPDNMFAARSSSGKLTGVSGGTTEALIRTLYFLETGNEMVSFKLSELRNIKGTKEFYITIGEMELGFAIVSDLRSAHALMEDVKQGRKNIHYIEVMACGSGCINGGGQPFINRRDEVKLRMKAIYDMDDKDSIKVAHKNPQLQELMASYLEKPLSEKCMSLLHTSFQEREVL